MASWVSLNDLYVKTEGESTVNGTLKIVNSNTGTSNGLLVNQPGSTDSFYNVGDEIKTLRDSVSSGTNRIKFYIGTMVKVVSAPGDSCCLWTPSEFKESFGSATSFVDVINADGNAARGHVEGTVINASGVYAVLRDCVSVDTKMRFSYFVATLV